MRWVGHVACMGRTEMYTGYWCRNLEDTHHLDYLGTDGKIILRWIFKKLCEMAQP